MSTINFKFQNAKLQNVINKTGQKVPNEYLFEADFKLHKFI